MERLTKIVATLGPAVSSPERIRALIEAGIRLRHWDRGQNRPYYRTSVDTTPAGPFSGQLIVSMRPLLPRDAHERAYVRSIALAIACDIHPLNNLRVLRYLVRTLAVSEEQKNAWYRHWIEHGLASLEARLIAEARCGRYTLGDMVTLADVVIVPQIFNAQRMDCNLNSIPTIMRIFENCMQLPAFIEAHPSSQPDAE